MIPSQIIARARRLWNIDIANYDDTTAYEDLNQVKNDLWSAIVSVVNEDYNWQEWTTDLVANQSEYSMVEVSSTLQWSKKLNTISVSYDWKMYDWTTELIYIPATFVDYKSLKHDWEFYVQNQEKDHPIYCVIDNHYRIAPLSTTWVVNWIKLTWTRNITDYTSWTTEAQMIIPYDYHEVLTYGLIPYICNQKFQIAEYLTAKQEYERLRDQATRRLSDRVEAPFYNQYPDDFEQQNTSTNQYILNG